MIIDLELHLVFNPKENKTINPRHLGHQRMNIMASSQPASGVHLAIKKQMKNK
jgi:hypothetical protein